MNSFTSWVDDIFGALTILVQLATVGLILTIVSRGKVLREYRRTVEKYALWIGFLVTFLAIVGSLLYSEIIGYTPCLLCWYQRICMYPLALIFFIAILKKDRNALPYTLALSTVGGVIALFQYCEQIFHTSLFPCEALGGETSCVNQFVFQYGYITIPMMALSVFLLMALVSIAGGIKKE